MDKAKNRTEKLNKFTKEDSTDHIKYETVKTENESDDTLRPLIPRTMKTEERLAPLVPRMQKTEERMQTPGSSQKPTSAGSKFRKGSLEEEVWMKVKENLVDKMR